MVEMTLLDRLIDLHKIATSTQGFTIGETEWLLISKPDLVAALDELLKQYAPEGVEGLTE